MVEAMAMLPALREGLIVVPCVGVLRHSVRIGLGMEMHMEEEGGGRREEGGGRREEGRGLVLFGIPRVTKSMLCEKCVGKGEWGMVRYLQGLGGWCTARIERRHDADSSVSVSRRLGGSASEGKG